MSDRSSIVEFLTQRWDEQLSDKGQHWSQCKAPAGGECSCAGRLGEKNRAIIADIAAKRRLLEMHTLDCWVGAGPDGDDDYFCDGCPCGSVHSSFPDEVVCQTHRVLAAPFSSHADFRPEWSLSE